MPRTKAIGELRPQGPERRRQAGAGQKTRRKKKRGGNPISKAKVLGRKYRGKRGWPLGRSLTPLGNARANRRNRFEREHRLETAAKITVEGEKVKGEHLWKEGKKFDKSIPAWRCQRSRSGHPMKTQASSTPQCLETRQRQGSRSW